MTFGISRVHGTLINPKNLACVGLQDFTLTFCDGDIGTTLAADAANANGALDQVFRTAVQTVGSISRVGTLTTSSRTINFALESLGFEGDNSGNGFLGTGPDNEAGTVTTTAGALQAAVQALGTVTTVVAGVTTVVHLTSATVVKLAY